MKEMSYEVLRNVKVISSQRKEREGFKTVNGLEQVDNKNVLMRVDGKKEL